MSVREDKHARETVGEGGRRMRIMHMQMQMRVPMRLFAQTPSPPPPNILNASSRSSICMQHPALHCKVLHALLPSEAV